MASEYGYAPSASGLSLAGKIAIGCAALVVIPFVLLLGIGIYANLNRNPETEFERLLDRTPEADGFFAALKVRYPDDYRMLRSLVMVEIEKGEAKAAQTVLISEVRKFIKDHARDAAAAPDDRLLALLAAQSAGTARLAQDRDSCLADVRGRFRELPSMSDDQRKVLAAFPRRYVEAAAAGRDRPVKRPPHTYAEQEQLRSRIEPKGVRFNELLFTVTPAASDDQLARHCQVMNLLHQTLLEMPKPVAARFYSEMIAAN